MNRIETAIRLALEVHAGQVDKGGAPYILHPLHVMDKAIFAFRKMFPELAITSESGEDCACAAILHDSIEDAEPNAYIRQPNKQSAQEFVRLQIEFQYCPHILKAVEALTRRDGENWNDYLARVETDWIARIVKIADLEHNMDLTRLPVITKDDEKRAERYRMALVQLQA